MSGLSFWQAVPSDEQLLELLSDPGRAATVAAMPYERRLGYEVAYARRIGRGVNEARRQFDRWVSDYCDALNVREIGR